MEMAQNLYSVAEIKRYLFFVQFLFDCRIELLNSKLHMNNGFILFVTNVSKSRRISHTGNQSVHLVEVLHS